MSILYSHQNAYFVIPRLSFDEESINWLHAVTFLRASGMSIPEIRHYFDLYLKGTSTIRERQEIPIQPPLQFRLKYPSDNAHTDTIWKMQSTAQTRGFFLNNS